MTDRELMQQAPVAYMHIPHNDKLEVVFTARKFNHKIYKEIIPLYAFSPQRDWRGLTNEEIGSVIEASQITLKNYCSEDKQTEYARAIEAKLKEKNT